MKALYTIEDGQGRNLQFPSPPRDPVDGEFAIEVEDWSRLPTLEEAQTHHNATHGIDG